MKERIPFAILAILSIVDVGFAVLILPDVDQVAMLLGGAVQLAGAVMIGYGDRVPVLAGLAPLLVGSTLLLMDPAWRELYAEGAVLWLPVAAGIVSFNLVRLARRPAQLIGGVTGLAGWVVVATVIMSVAGWSSVTIVLVAAAPIVSGFCISLALRLRRVQRDQLERARLDREAGAERIRRRERERLAEELHDTVTHRVTLLVMQANVLATTTGDETTRTVATSLGHTGRAALQELREFLDVLHRDPVDPNASEPALSKPADLVELPGRDLVDLIEEHRLPETDLEFIAAGSSTPVSMVVARTVFRVVQEALTNWHKHVPNAPAQVSLETCADAVELQIRTGPAVGSSVSGTGSGRGLHALGRRVVLLGGRFEAGPDLAGHFVVSARVPRGTTVSGDDA